MNKPLRLTLAITVVFTATIAMSPAAQAADIDACELVSADQAGKILGEPITVHKMKTSGPSSMCKYSGSKVSSGFMLIAGHVDYSSAKAEADRQKKSIVSDNPPFFPQPSVSDVKGLGDAAFLSKASGYFQLHVLSRGTSIVVNFNADAAPQLEAQARQLAQVALKNLH